MGPKWIKIEPKTGLGDIPDTMPKWRPSLTSFLARRGSKSDPRTDLKSLKIGPGAYCSRDENETEIEHRLFVVLSTFRHRLGGQNNDFAWEGHRNRKVPPGITKYKKMMKMTPRMTPETIPNQSKNIKRPFRTPPNKLFIFFLIFIDFRSQVGL